MSRTLRPSRPNGATLPPASLLLLLGGAALPGCADVAGDPPSVGAAEQAVINGTPSNPEQSGLVQVFTDLGTQSGTLLRNSWVLTRNPGPRTTGGLSVARVVMGSQSVNADFVVQWPDDPNLVLMHLAAPMTMLGSTTSWNLWRFWPDANSDLVGATLKCYGFGNNTAVGGAGVLRYASLPVTGATATGYTLGTNAAGQSLAPGDSGGPCFSGVYLTGVTLGVSQIPAASFRAWALDTLGESAPPGNDSRANAAYLFPSYAGSTPIETVVAGSTVNATHDGPAGACGCAGGNNVWYWFSVSGPTAVYFDTSGSDFDTSVTVTNASGVPVSGMCNDDASCTGGGFTSARQSQVAGVLPGGSYKVAVGGCGAGRFQLHYQRLALGTVSGFGALASYFYPGRLSGSDVTSTRLVGASSNASACGGAGSGEDARWFTTCGDRPQFFSMCQSDGGAYSRRIGATTYDPVLYVLSARSSTVTSCNDDAALGAGENCTGTGGDAAQYGARLANVVVARGLHAVFVDSNTGGSEMTYTLRYTVR